MPPASSKTESEARNGAIEKIGGLLICHPSAEATGVNSGSRCNAETSVRIVSKPAREPQQFRISRVSFVHERACDRAGTGV